MRSVRAKIRMRLLQRIAIDVYCTIVPEIILRAASHLPVRIPGFIAHIRMH